MKTIEVRSPGLLTTVQDLGREGFGSMGVSSSGAADPTALRVGNRLVSNVENAAALEMTLLGGTFVVPEGAIIALTGSDFPASLDGAAIPQWTSIEVSAGQTLRAGATRSGVRCYLCVSGGIATKPFLGSRSTHLLSGLGGLGGRALRKGDLLPIGLQIGLGSGPFQKRSVSAQALHHLRPRKVLRVTPGPQSEWFPYAAHTIFYGRAYQVSEESNRMGLRLEGPPLPVDQLGEMITEGVSLGAIQITAAGLPIILFVAAQTTGGYPKIPKAISPAFTRLPPFPPPHQTPFHPLA